jgi:HK97 family phage major capsid protein
MLDNENEIKAALEEFSTTFADSMVKAQADIKQLKVDLATEKKASIELEKKLNRTSIGRSDAMAGTADPAALAIERKALATFARSAGNGDISELKSLSVGSDPDGGYLVMPNRSAEMTTRLFEASPIRQLARIVPMTTGDAFEEPVDIDEAEAVWVGELSPRAGTATPRVKMLTIPLHEIYANPTASQKILDTSYIDVGAWLDGKINDRFARTDAAAFIAGNGVGRPRGILSQDMATDDDFTRPWGTLQYIKTGVADDFAATAKADVLKTLVWSLRAPYRKGAVWLMNSQTASIVDKFKDGQNNYIWREGMTAGSPPALLGYPVEFDENMPNVGAPATPIAFGNFKLGYTIVERPGLKMLRDPYTNKPNVMFYAYRRVGGDVSNSDTIKLLKCGV